MKIKSNGVSQILFTREGASSFIYATYPPASGGPPSIAGVHGLAARKVYLSYGVAPRTGELLPHLFTLTCDLRADPSAV